MIAVIEPATEAVLAEFPRAGVEEVDAAVARARGRFRRGGRWRRPTARRGSCARRRARLHREYLAELEARNAGKPIADARGEMDMVVATFRYYAGAPERLLGDTIPVAGGQAFTVREPLGVVGLIVPWNFPLVIASWKLAPALAAGNTVVLKPAELTPLTALRFAEIAPEAGIPDGVVNVVAGPGSVCGQRLVEHPDVAKIAFTGSTEVGRSIAAGAAATIKRVTLELGGKSPNFVFADADLEAAAAAAPMAVFGNAGQDCCARSRILVQDRCSTSSWPRSRAPVERSASATRSTSDPDGAADLGRPAGDGVLVRQRRRAGGDPRQRARGAGLLVPADRAVPGRAGARAAREEIFGPVATVIPFGDEEDAIRLANDTIYGLSGSIWTRDGARALRVARAIDAGVLSINSNTSVRVATPFGGFKQSGYGRELGPHALDAYTEVKSIFYATS